MKAILFPSAETLTKWLASRTDADEHVVALPEAEEYSASLEIEHAIIAHGWWRIGPAISRRGNSVAVIRPMEKGKVLSDHMTAAAIGARVRGWMMPAGNALIKADPMAQDVKDIPEDLRSILEDHDVSDVWEMVPVSMQNIMLASLALAPPDERQGAMISIADNLVKIRQRYQ
ncbi:hypothetical protein [Parasulfitobacter algicola]|uniref:Uncharacterized protein n=1 Tax=Parasulfitobacter algicola TaxID=2614809 RepID=A0ABX2IM15_9RHOB|nr:hypothetical protein [Sulfitobacter algicola]NSX53926.1 hypothetical protein [Sulfitobacter algicola]